MEHAFFFLAPCWAYVGPTLGQFVPLVHVGLLGAVLEPSLDGSEVKKRQCLCTMTLRTLSAVKLCTMDTLYAVDTLYDVGTMLGQEWRVHLGLSTKAQMNTPFLCHVRAKLGRLEAMLGPMLGQCWANFGQTGAGV